MANTYCCCLYNWPNKARELLSPWEPFPSLVCTEIQVEMEAQWRDPCSPRFDSCIVAVHPCLQADDFHAPSGPPPTPTGSHQPFLHIFPQRPPVFTAVKNQTACPSNFMSSYMVAGGELWSVCSVYRVWCVTATFFPLLPSLFTLLTYFLTRWCLPPASWWFLIGDLLRHKDNTSTGLSSGPRENAKVWKFSVVRITW